VIVAATNGNALPTASRAPPAGDPISAAAACRAWLAASAVGSWTGVTTSGSAAFSAGPKNS